MVIECNLLLTVAQDIFYQADIIPAARWILDIEIGVMPLLARF
jgi:hypothetical protein